MKKFTLFILAMLFIILNISAQNRHIVVGKNYENPNEISLVAERGVSTTIKFDLNELNLTEIETNYGLANKISSAKATIMLDAGSPELFYMPTAVIIPDLGSAELEVITGEYTEYTDIEIVPSKGNILRTVDPSTIPYTKGEVYSHDAFFPGTLAQINETFIMRDVRGLSLFVYPVQYNPVTKTLRVYSEITVTVNYTETKGENEFTTQKRHASIDPEFNAMYSRLFINHSVLQQRGFPTGEEGEILIICHTPWVNEMQDYVDWKRTIGRKTTIVPTSDISPLTNTNLKTYIQNYYNNPDNNLAFVLLVGDYQQIPVHQVGVPRTDLPYVRFNAGNYLDALIGRMSCESPADVQTQVQRSIWYEKEIATTDTWLSVGMGIARNEGGPGQGGHDGQEADYVHMNNIRTRLFANGYSTVYQDYDGSCPGIPNTTAAIMSQHFNSGVGVANYCNHGSPTGWSVAGYSNSHVNALQNAGKLPYIFAVACNNGEFGPWQYNTGNAVCFAETWMRATKSGQPTGAIAFFGATISIGWDPTMTAQDEFVDLCLGITHTAGGFNYGQPGLTIRSISGAMLNASQRMLQRHGTGCLADYNSWLVFGDPSLMFRTKTPQEMTITHLPTVSPGTTDFSVTCDVEGAKATISYKNESNEVIILGAAVVDGGTANITFTEPTADQTEFTLAVTGFNKVTYLATLDAGPLVLNAPEKLAAEVEKANHVVLTWEAPEGKGLTVQGYNVIRDGEQLNEELVTETTFTNIVSANGEYKYEVTAVYGASLESDPCDPVIVTVTGMCVPLTPITVAQTEGKSIQISWNAPLYEGTELAGYNIYKDETQLNTEIIPAATLSYLDEIEPEIEVCYHVEVIYNDCEEPLKTENKCIKLVSVKDLPGESISIYPNPTSGELTIDNGQLTIMSVAIYDVYGRKVLTNHLIASSSHHLINVSHLTNGIYFINIDTEQGSVMKKLVKN